MKAEKMKFVPCNLHLQEGDIISSQKGILQQSALGNKHYLVKKLKFMGGNGCFEALSDKIEVDDVKEVPRHESP